MTGFDYGNARLRAMKSRLFDRLEYHRLAAVPTIDTLLAALASGPYRLDVEAALPRYRGIRRLDEVLRLNLARTLQAVRRFYEEPVRTSIDLLLGRWDLHNVRTILRGRARVAAIEEILPLLVPAGRLDDPALRELAGQPGVRATLDLMGTWSMPSRRMARAVLAVWSSYERTGNPVVLENALNRAYAAHLDQALTGEPPELARVLRSELDQINLLAALRLREAVAHGEQDREPISDRYLEGGRLPRHALVAVSQESERERVYEILEGNNLPHRWQEPLRAWIDHDDLLELSNGLDRASFDATVALFATGDPLGMAVPIAFVRAKEEEVRNLHRIGRGLMTGSRPEEIEDLLVVM